MSLPLWWCGAARVLGQPEDAIWHEYQTKIVVDSNKKDLARFPLKIYNYSHIKNTKVGTIDRDGIGLWQGLSEQNKSSVLRHEIGHQFLEQLCPGRISMPAVHEIFAQWISGDFNRIAAYSSEFAYGHLAALWLKEKNLFTESLDPESNKISYALGRILMEKSKSESLISHLINITRFCLKDEFDGSLAARAIFTELLGSEIKTPILKGDPDILVVDGLSLEPLLAVGKTKTPFAPGSILKPLLVSLVKELRLPTMALSSPYWQCGRSGKLVPLGATREPMLWTWDQALIHSCNGFFLEHREVKKFDLRPWAALLTQFGVKHDLNKDFKIESNGSPNDQNIGILQKSIGLVPGLEISVEQVLGLYRWLYDRAPDIAYSLLKTPLQGTLRDHPQSRWFVENGFALKTGTFRTTGSEPHDGWIVAVGPLTDKPDNPPLLGVIHGAGQAPNELLHNLAKHLKSHVAGAEVVRGDAQVQILGGLVHPGPMKLSCAHQLYQIKELPPHEKIDGLRPKTIIPTKKSVLRTTEPGLYTCYQGPITISLTNQNKIRYRYFGRLRVDPLDSNLPNRFSLPVTERRAGARQGSSLVIETSLQHYISNVVSNEYPDGYRATLQALALAVGLNSRSRRHEARPVCDTSHCQIFGGQYPSRWNRPDSSRKMRLFEASHWALTQLARDSTCRSDDWYPFSLGGGKHWQHRRPLNQVAASLGVGLPLAKIMVRSQVEVAHGQGVLSLSCEVFRNQLRLPSCPHVAQMADGFAIFNGTGDGHGLGLSLIDADLLAARGKDAVEIFRRYFPLYPRQCLGPGSI